MKQSTVFSQVIKLIPRTYFEAAVRRHKGDRGIRQLNCWTWFGALLFGQLTGHDSIRSIERVFAYSEKHMKSLGLSSIRKSTFADANQKRPLALLEDVFFYLLTQAKLKAPTSGFKIQGQLLALDASVIDLSLKLMPWARFRSDEACLKLHTAIDLAGDLPEIVVICPGTVQDMKMARQRMSFKPETTIIFDKGYSNYSWYQSLIEEKVFFVTRMKTYPKFKVVSSRKTNRSKGYLCDQEIYIKGKTAGKSRLGKLRRISYRDPKTKKKLVFLTNRFDLNTEIICALYKARWSVELFFKTIKQNLKIKKFLGTTPHAVHAQIWVALIAYLLIQIIRFGNRTHISVPATMAILSVLIFSKMPLTILLGQLPRGNNNSNDSPKIQSN